MPAYQDAGLAYQSAGLAFQDGASLVEVPDVVGETQAAGTLELETALFDVAVTTAYSPTVAIGLIISQSPAGGEDAPEGATVTITVSLGPEPVRATPEGGSARRQHRKRYYVEIDGQYFEVNSQAEAEQQILERALSLATEVAEEASERSIKRVRRGKQAVTPSLPSMSSSPELAPIVDQYREKITAIYRQIAIDAEIRELMRVKFAEQDEEDAIFVLLH
jgi:hypothetical protein